MLTRPLKVSILLVSSPDLIGHIANWKQFMLGFGATFLHIARFALL